MSWIRRWAWLVLLILFALIGSWLFFRGGNSSSTTKEESPVMGGSAARPSLVLKSSEVLIVASSPLVETISVSGSLQAEVRADVVAKVSGRLLKLAVKEGDSVNKGQLLAQIELVETEARNTQQEASLEQAKSQLTTVERNYKNDKVLFEKGFISKNSFQNSEAQWTQAKSAVQSAQAALTISQKSVADTRVVAPFNGQVAESLAHVGENVRVEQKLFSVVDIARIEIPLQIPVEKSAGVKAGQSVLLFFDHLSAPVLTKAVRVTPSATTSNRAISVYVVLDNKDTQYRPGMFVKGFLAVREYPQVLSIPFDAVREQLGEKVIYVVNRQNKIEQRKVKVGRVGVKTLAGNQPNQIEVLSGLELGETVIVKDLGNLTSGQSVRIEP